jgi:hypothetical protein
VHETSSRPEKRRQAVAICLQRTVLKEMHHMLPQRIFAGLAAALLVSAGTALGHHAFSADFDANKPVTLDGTITRVEWTNPHAYVYVDVKDSSGATANWKVELGSQDELAGWTTPPLQAGQKISIRGWQAKDGSTFANAGALTIATGQKLSGASSYYVNYFDSAQSGSLARGVGGSRSQNTGAAGPVGTRGVDDGDVLPDTASRLTLIGVLAALSLVGAVSLGCARDLISISAGTSS